MEAPAFDLRAVLLETSPELLRTEVHAGNGGHGGPLHKHLRQEERFLAQEGMLRVRVGLRGSRLVGPSEEVAVPPVRPHTFKVASDEAHFIAEFRPARRIAEVFRDIFSLPQARFGVPKLTDVAVLIDRYPEDFFYAPFVPIVLQRGLAGMFGRRRR